MANIKVWRIGGGGRGCAASPFGGLETGLSLPNMILILWRCWKSAASCWIGTFTFGVMHARLHRTKRL